MQMATSPSLPTLQALLGARLDQLDAAERSVLERGAIEGETFHRGAVQALAPDDTQVTPRLAGLVRKALIRPDKPLLPGEDAFRFHHLLLRDAAYAAMPKALRADLHRRFAAWLGEHGSALVELDELLGYHLGQACRYRAELGMPDDIALAEAARRHLMAGGHRASRRQDHYAAASLLERAAALAPPGEIDLILEFELGGAWAWSGRLDEVVSRADARADSAAARGDRAGELCGRVQAALLRVGTEPEGATERLAALVEQALPVFEAAGDNMALYIAYFSLSDIAFMRGQMGAQTATYEKALDHARQAGYIPAGATPGRAGGLFFGPTPVTELLAWLDENDPRAGRDYFLRAYRAGALAMLGRFDEARAILAETRAELTARSGAGGVVLADVTAFSSVWVELWAGDPLAAAEFGAAGVRLHEQSGEQGALSSALGFLAQALCALDRLDEADALAGRAADLGASDDVVTQMLWRQVRAKVLARRGVDAEAERLAREAVAMGAETDLLNWQGDAYADLAEVLVLGGRLAEARVVLEEAVERFDRKGNLAMAARTRARLAASPA